MRLRLRVTKDMKNKKLKTQLIKAYKSMGRESLKLLEEWEQTSNEIGIVDE